MKKLKFNALLIMLFLFVFVVVPPCYAENSSNTMQTGKIDDNDLSKAVASQGKDALKLEVSQIGGNVVNAVRALFITFFAVAVLFMGLQAAGGGLKDPRKVELMKGGGISAIIAAVLVYKAETIVAFVLNLVGVDIGSILK